MLNDEIESVRLNAIKSIWRRAIRSSVVIDKDKVESFIIALRDTDNDVRISAYKLLGYEDFSVELHSSNRAEKNCKNKAGQRIFQATGSPYSKCGKISNRY